MSARPLLSLDPDAALLTGKSEVGVWSAEDGCFLSGAVLALDPGRTTGWCLYHPARPAQTGGFTMAGDLGAGLAAFGDWLRGMINRNNPAIVAIERPFGRAAFTNDLPAQILGVAHMVAHRLAVSRREYTASAIKKAVTGSGRATKAEVKRAVIERYGIAAATDHEADAAAVAVLAWAREAQR